MMITTTPVRFVAECDGCSHPETLVEVGYVSEVPVIQLCDPCMGREAALYEFGTMNTLYQVRVEGFGLMRVSRTSKNDYDALAGTSVAESFLCDQVIAVPCTREGSVLEDRKVAFLKDGRTVAVTSYADSRAYDQLEWGTYEQGVIRAYRSM